MRISQLALLTWTYLTLVGMLGSTLMVPLAYLDFELRKEYIQEVLCINREKPEMSCEGKCLLMKKLDRAHDLPATDRPSSNENFQLSFFRIIDNQLLYEPNGIMEASLFNPYLQPGSTSRYSNSIFHPPQN